MERKPSAYSIGVSKWRFPRQSVASQLKIFIPVGTAITIEAIMKKACSEIGRPTVNRWYPHTSREKKPIATVEAAIALYPNTGLRAKTGRTSEMIPNAGRTMMYTSGWAEKQNACWESTG